MFCLQFGVLLGGLNSSESVLFLFVNTVLMLLINSQISSRPNGAQERPTVFWELVYNLQGMIEKNKIKIPHHSSLIRLERGEILPALNTS